MTKPTRSTNSFFSTRLFTSSSSPRVCPATMPSSSITSYSSASFSSSSSQPIASAAAGQHRSDSAYTPSSASSVHSACVSSNGNTTHQRRQQSRSSQDCGENGLQGSTTTSGGVEQGQERTMGLISAILMIVGTLIGTGIFASPGPLFDSVHCTQTSFIIWAFAGVVCTIGAFAYAELGTMFPASGGDFQYLRRAYGKKVAWVFGWSFITILNPIGTAGIAGVLGRYAVDLIVYSRTGSSVGGASRLSAAGSSAGAMSTTQDAIINTLGRMFWTSINGTAAVWAAGAGVGNGSNGPTSSALDTGYAPFPKAPLPPNHSPSTGTGPGGEQHADAMPWLVRGFSIGAIVLMGLINIFFKEGGKYASNLLAIFKIGGMCMLIVIGSMQAVKNHAQSEALQIPIQESSQNVFDYVSALCFAFFAYNGFNNINLGLGELRDPERNLKRAVFIAMPFVTILFLLANFAFFSILSSYDLRHVHSLSLHAGHTVLGQPGGFLMAGTVVASALGSINANLWAGSRLLVIMAKDNTIIPFPVAKVWSRTGTQAIAILILVGQASFHSLINLDFKTFSKIYSAVGWTWYGLSVAGLLYLRKKRPNYPRPVKVFAPLAAFFVLIAAILVVGSLTLAFMSSAVQKTGGGGNGDDDEEDDVATGSGADGSESGGRYVPIIMFGMAILFMSGVIPAFYLTKRYNQEHGLKAASRDAQSSTTTDSRDSDSSSDGNDPHQLGKGGEMVQITRTGPLHHQTAVIIDHNDYLTTCTGGFGAFCPETLKDGRPARRHSSAASSVTLVGEASKRRKNKHRKHKSRDGSKPSHQHQQRRQRQGEPSRSQSLDPAGPRDPRRSGVEVEEEEEEELARIQSLRGIGSGGAGGTIRHTNLDHAELGLMSPSSSNTNRTRSSTANSDTGSDCDNSDDDDDEDETDIDSARPENQHNNTFLTTSAWRTNRPTNLLFFPFDPTDPTSSSSLPSSSSGGVCMSPTMLTPFGSASQTASNSPMLESSSPTFAATTHDGYDGNTFLTCGYNTRSDSRSSETTVGLESDHHHQQQQQREEDVKGKGTRTRQSSTRNRVDEVEEGECEARSHENNTNNNNNTTHYGSCLTDFNSTNNHQDRQSSQDHDGRVQPLPLSPGNNSSSNNNPSPSP